MRSIFPIAPDTISLMVYGVTTFTSLIINLFLSCEFLLNDII